MFVDILRDYEKRIGKRMPPALIKKTSENYKKITNKVEQYILASAMVPSIMDEIIKILDDHIDIATEIAKIKIKNRFENDDA